METVEKKGLLDDIAEIITLSKKFKLTQEFFENASPFLTKVTKLFKITETQAALFSLILEHSDEAAVSVSAIAKIMDCGKIEMLKYMDDFDLLEKQNLIKANNERYQFYGGSAKLPGYFVPTMVIKTLRTGRLYRNIEYRGLSPAAFLDTARQLLESRREYEINDSGFLAEIKSLFLTNRKSTFMQGLKAHKLGIRQSVELLAFCCKWIDAPTESISIREMRSLLSPKELRNFEQSLKTNNHKLAKEGIIIYNIDCGLADTETWTLSEKAKDTFFADINFKEKKQKNGNNIIKADSIQERTMFYPASVSSRITELTSLLCKDNFSNIKARLADKKMTTTFAILFQGPPGTGKTETAYQIARNTGRNLCLVDISETKSQWFGESEKRIKAIFDRYKSLIKNNDLTPILFFNEADAVLGKRREIGDTYKGTAQTENNIQNIILQEMENLDGGILIATTNMATNLDKAFERRFLYKIEFEKPDINARTAIWQNRITDLTTEDAEALSRGYDFSGGQIENIARKQVINSMLYGNTFTFNDLAVLCEDEVIDKGARRIGFCNEA
ncbi:MAG: ATP-binding protein [Spirochaetaceae bacterium]|nr:ATP-binding protein [Spirochaetaceae bacterium]